MQRPLFQIFARWLHSLKSSHAPPTLDTWRCYVQAHWLPFFVDQTGFAREQFHLYLKTRLGNVQKATVKKERSALLNFLEWGLNIGDLEAPSYAPPQPLDPSMREQWAKGVANSWGPQLPDRGLGTPYKQRRRVASIDLEPGQVHVSSGDPRARLVQPGGEVGAHSPGSAGDDDSQLIELQGFSLSQVARWG